MSTASDREPIPEELTGGYRRIDVKEAARGADVAVLYTAADTRTPAVAAEGLDPAALFNASNGRNYRTGTVELVERDGDQRRVVVDDVADRQVEQLVVEPSAENPDMYAVYAETPGRKRLLGRLESLYAAAGGESPRT